MKDSINDLINKNKLDGCEIYISGEVNKELINKAEDILGVSFPPSYSYFIEKFGSIEIDNRSFAGLFANEVGQDGDVVSFTLFQREDIGLPNKYIALDFQDGDYLLCIDTSIVNSEHECPIVLVNPDSLENHKVNDSFYDYITEYLDA
ncbi:SMI1/KNR4 family protein [Photorhabdus kleinii]|uniref:SMI1/KNR4 family protein n=1 Tax=Photorhabdus kleinii TaxID=768034 RepID=UPI0021D4ECD5|nr:SMI1/KNR4 family protein [Photorhabdus kleinii]MCT8345588.1 SMI1/KNR4 family protein [Photorhabdus kleinii]